MECCLPPRGTFPHQCRQYIYRLTAHVQQLGQEVSSKGGDINYRDATFPSVVRIVSICNVVHVGSAPHFALFIFLELINQLYLIIVLML